MDRSRLETLREFGTIADIPELAETILRLAERVTELQEALALARDAVNPEAFPCTHETLGRVLGSDWAQRYALPTSSTWRA